MQEQKGQQCVQTRGIGGLHRRPIVDDTALPEEVYLEERHRPLYRRFRLPLSCRCIGPPCEVGGPVGPSRHLLAVRVRLAPHVDLSCSNRGGPPDSRRPPAQAGAMASTRTGLPLPCTIFSGAAMSTAPVGGSWSRLQRLARPNLPAPCMVAWLGNGGLKVPACPASVPIVSTPTPSTSRSCASSRDVAASNPGLCGPSLEALMNEAPVRVLQPVRKRTHAPAG